MSNDFAYTVGIDLGTTNTVISYRDNSNELGELKLLEISQFVKPGIKEKHLKLPSFLYQPLKSEIEDSGREQFFQSWENEGSWIAGIYARDRGAEVPARFISSAKSWLCQSGTDRKKDFLPFQSEEDIEKISPFDVTAHYLRYISYSWQQEMNCNLGDQEITITVPASFDEEARKLTEEAAKSIGFINLTILEEPQAALYSWVASRGDNWREEVEENDVILVCDIGGGTSDFSLIQVVNNDGNLSLERSAVGEHILLGGDNMDLALAYHAKAKMETGKKLTSWQLRGLWFKARQIKEDLLSGKTDTAKFTVLGTGIKKLIGGTLKAEFSAEEVNKILVDGFFPLCTINDFPKEAATAGLQEIGLKYATDASITKHLALFIARQSENENFKWPTKILFNGGVFNCDSMRERCLDVINSWLSSAGKPAITPLNHRSLDNAVALGASYFSAAKKGKGIRIRAGIPRTYYIQVETAMPAIPGMEAPQKAFCIAPFGMEEGSRVSLESETFALTTGVPATFNFLSSTVKQEDQVGQVYEDWDEDEIQSSTSMEVTLPSDDTLSNPIPVKLGASVNDVGTLELFFEHTDSSQKWKLEYNVREDN